MRYPKFISHFLFVFVLFNFALIMSATGQEPECDNPPPPNAPIPAELLNYCGTHTDISCDLEITNWDAVTYKSPDIRIGDPFNATGSTPQEWPRFFFDKPNNRFYTKLYVKFENVGGGPAPASEVTVDFSFKETENPADVNNAAIPWQTIGTYAMNIPAPATIGVLFPSSTHCQQKGVCWHRPTNTQFPKQLILRAVINWSGGPDGDTSNNTAYSLYDLTEIERLAQIAFAMDLSGSMTGTLPSGTTKLVEAKQKAMLFANMVENDNQLGVYGFATNNSDNTNFTATYIGTDNLSHTETLTETSEIANIRTISGNLDRLVIAGEIWNQNAHNCTPVGQGLLRARSGLGSLTPPTGANTAIVIFSDGLQNVPPFVNTTPSYTCGTWPTYTNVSTVKTFADEDIQIYSVYFGPEVGWAYNLMNDIKQQTGGDYVYGAGTELELAAAYYAIRGLVDDMIYFAEEESTSVNEPYPEFKVNFDSADRTATVALAWSYGNGETRLKLQYRKKGDIRWIDGMPPDKPSDFASFMVCRFDPGANTTWEFRVVQLSPQRGWTRFNIAVFSEVENAQLLPSLDDSNFEAGKSLPIIAELRSTGHPLAGAIVNAIVKVPTRPFSSTLRKYSKKFSNTTDNDTKRVSTMVKELKKFLTEDEGTDELYLYKEVMVSLRDDGSGIDKVKGDGIYSGQLLSKETEVAGDYQVTITAKATLPSGKTVERVAKLSTIANVGPADPEKSKIQTVLSKPLDDGSRLVTVTIFPTDKFGNAAFPGSGSKINVSAKGTKLEGGLLDNLESSFTQKLILPKGKRARVKVDIDGVTLKSQYFGLKIHEIGFNSGIAVPHGSFSNMVSKGLYGGLGYNYWFNQNFAIHADFGFNRFDDQGNGTKQLINLSSCLQYHYILSQLHTYFESGIGYYNLENKGSAGGFSACLGVQYSLTENWYLDLNMKSHRVGGSLDLEFSQFRGGIIYRF